MLVEKSLAARASRHVVILRFLFDLTVFFLVLLPMAARVSALGLSALAQSGPDSSVLCDRDFFLACCKIPFF